jgi:SAM-dependent methyltransferase
LTIGNWLESGTFIMSDATKLSLATKNNLGLKGDRRFTKLDRVIETYLPFSYSSSMRRNLSGCSFILDVGCGPLSPLAKMMSRDVKIVGIDIFKPYLQRALLNDTHEHIVLCDAKSLPFASDSLDAVVASGIIEHLGPLEGSALIGEMLRIARERVLITTVNGFLQQSAYDGNPQQAHISGWTVREFRKRGFKITGIRGLRPLRGERASPRITPLLLGHFVCFISELLLISRFLPQTAFELLCVKRKHENALTPGKGGA